MIRILVFLVLILLIGGSLRWFIHTAPAIVRQILQRLLIVCGGIVLVYLIAAGRLNWVLPVIGGLVAILARSLPYLLRFAPVLQRLWSRYRTNRPQPGAENVSTVETDFVRMQLDHDLGEISGEVLRGRFTGRTFSDLDLESLLQLRDEVSKVDHDAVALIESYLDRIYPNDWRDANDSRSEHRHSGDTARHDDMKRDEAFEILGLTSDSSPSDIIEAHRRLIQKIHPDRGGSDYLASKINRARDVLLG